MNPMTANPTATARHSWMYSTLSVFHISHALPQGVEALG
jgi:hypothetical protein